MDYTKQFQDNNEELMKTLKKQGLMTSKDDGANLTKKIQNQSYDEKTNKIVINESQDNSNTQTNQEQNNSDKNMNINTENYLQKDVFQKVMQDLSNHFSTELKRQQKEIYALKTQIEDMKIAKPVQIQTQEQPALQSQTTATTPEDRTAQISAAESQQPAYNQEIPKDEPKAPQKRNVADGQESIDINDFFNFSKK